MVKGTRKTTKTQKPVSEKRTLSGKSKSDITKIKRREIIRGPKTAWIFYCIRNRENVLKSMPHLSFGEICKEMAKNWHSMSPEEKQDFHRLHLDDKKRYSDDMSKLSASDMSILKKYRKQQRRIKKNKPRSPLSAYMFYVMANRDTITRENPGIDFESIGRMLGKRWQTLTASEKIPFQELSARDKSRYETEISSLSQVKP
jgi:hypothetical protein